MGRLVEDGKAVLSPGDAIDLARLQRTFTLRTSEGFVENFGTQLLQAVAQDAPGVRLRFVAKTDKDSASLRDGTVDLETGVVGEATGPEVRTQLLFRDRFVAVVRAEHALARGKVTPARYVAARHISVSRRALEQGPVDAALSSVGLLRDIVASVAGFATALALARTSDLVATVPERHTGNLRDGMRTFPVPVPTPEINVSLLWHPRSEADPAHRWLRGCVVGACR